MWQQTVIQNQISIEPIFYSISTNFQLKRRAFWVTNAETGIILLKKTALKHDGMIAESKVGALAIMWLNKILIFNNILMINIINTQ